MNIVKLTESLAVSAQISPEDVGAIAAAGYQILINNRPDGEEATQPAAAEFAVAAQNAGMEYHHIPVTAGNFPGADFGAMCDLLDDPTRPVLAFCRSGTRCANLWVASRGEAEQEQAVQVASQRGYELVMASSFLGRNDSNS